MSRTPSHIPTKSWTNEVKSDLEEFKEHVEASEIRQPFKAVILEEIANFRRERGR